MNKNCLVIGGTRGIGREVCNILSLSTWDCIAVGRQQCDMNRYDSVNDYLKSFPVNVQIDAIVFSQGEWFSKPLTDHQMVDYYSQYTSRVLSPIRVIGNFVNHLRASAHGSVTFVSSTRGFMGGVETAPYSLACAAQIALVQGLAREYEGIRTNVICPGLTNTDLGKRVVETGGSKPGAAMNDPKVVAREIVNVIEDLDCNGKVIQVVNNLSSEAKWTW